MKKLRPWLFAAISGFLAICAISVALEATEDVWANWTVAGCFGAAYSLAHSARFDKAAFSIGKRRQHKNPA